MVSFLLIKDKNKNTHLLQSDSDASPQHFRNEPSAIYILFFLRYMAGHRLVLSFHILYSFWSRWYKKHWNYRRVWNLNYSNVTLWIISMSQRYNEQNRCNSGRQKDGCPNQEERALASSATNQPTLKKITLRFASLSLNYIWRLKLSSPVFYHYCPGPGPGPGPAVQHFTTYY